MITIDRLRDCAQMIHFFGLGFIQVKVGDRERYHFYHVSLPAFVDSPHDHRYSFTSYVMKGKLLNTVYSVVDPIPGHEGNIVETACTPCFTTTSYKPASLIKSAAFVTSAGGNYVLHKDTFHSVQPIYDHDVDCCVTFLTRSKPSKTHARVFRLRNEAEMCPFAKKYAESELWEIVDSCLKDTRASQKRSIQPC